MKKYLFLFFGILFIGELLAQIPFQRIDPVNLKQISDPLNSNLITLGTDGDSPINGWVGLPFITRDSSVQENLVVAVAFNGSGFLDDLGGTITFKYYNSAQIPIITENLVVESFQTVRNIGWLSNAGDYFSVEFVPDRLLLVGDTVVITTHSRLTGNNFLRLPEQNIEAANQPMPLGMSFIRAFDVDGNSHTVAANNAGAIYTADFELEIGMGNVPGWFSTRQTGFNPDIDIGTPEDVWANGGTYTGFPTGGAETIQVISNSTLDVVAGTGARTIEVTGLDENWLKQKDTLTLAGLVGVTSTTQWQRVYLARVLTSGTSGGNAGALTVRHSTTTANVFAVVPIGNNRSQLAMYTTADNENSILTSLFAGFGVNSASAVTNLSVLVREEGGVFEVYSTYSLGPGAQANPPKFYLPLPPRTDIKVRCISASDNNTAVSANLVFIESSN